MSEQLNISLRDQLIDLGINEILIDELVSVASRVNYGQVIILLYLIAVIIFSGWNSLCPSSFNILFSDAKLYSCLCGVGGLGRNAWKFVVGGRRKLSSSGRVGKDFTSKNSCIHGK